MFDGDFPPMLLSFAWDSLVIRGDRKMLLHMNNFTPLKFCYSQGKFSMLKQLKAGFIFSYHDEVHRGFIMNSRKCMVRHEAFPINACMFLQHRDDNQGL